MANPIYQAAATAIVIADTTDYSGDLGARTDQIDLTDLGDGEARQSAKVDLAVSGALLAPLYAVFSALEHSATAPESGELGPWYVGFSPSAVAGTANPGGLSGGDAAYTGTAGDSLADSLKQLELIGSHIWTADVTAVVQFSLIGWFKPAFRYASFVYHHDTDGAGEDLHSDADEMGLLVQGYFNEVQ